MGNVGGIKNAKRIREAKVGGGIIMPTTINEATRRVRRRSVSKGREELINTML